MTGAVRPMRQASFPGLCPVDAAVAQMAEGGIEERGAIFTRREVVDFILDLTGYTELKRSLKAVAAPVRIGRTLPLGFSLPA